MEVLEDSNGNGKRENYLQAMVCWPPEWQYNMGIQIKSVRLRNVQVVEVFQRCRVGALLCSPSCEVRLLLSIQTARRRTVSEPIIANNSSME